MTKSYSYPLDLTWSTEEVTSVLSFLNQVELAYESKSDAETLLSHYKIFKSVVKSKAQEKQIDREFLESSGYSTYKAVQAAKLKGRGAVSLG